MRIYLTASTENYTKNITPMRDIFDLIISLGHTHTNYYVKNIYGQDGSFDKKTSVGRGMQQSIRKSDLVIAEISVPSLGAGYNICLGVHYQIPVLCLCHEKFVQNIPSFIRDYDKHAIKLVIYNDKNLKVAVSKAITSIVPSKVRFNLNLDSDVNNFLGQLSRQSKMTKTEVVHELLREKLRKNENFKEAPGPV